MMRNLPVNCLIQVQATSGYTMTSTPINANDLKLFHYSENPDIEIFTPRPAKAKHGLENAVVWAVSEYASWAYCAPRDCPRLTFHANEETSTEEIAQFLDNDAAKKVLAIEAGWYERMISTTLYRYELNTDSFILKDKTAGYYVSEEPQEPVEIIKMDDLLKPLFEAGIEVRFMPELWDLREALLKTKLGWGFYRMNNACKPSKDLAYHPV